MLTGRVYRDERNLQAYVDDIFEQGSLFKSLRAGGYRVDSITEMQHDGESATNYYRLPRPYVSYEDYTQFTSWQLADLSLFRYAPHALRPAIYNEQAWRLQTLFGPGDTSARRHYPVNGAVVLNEFAHRMTPRVDEPVYKFIHVGIPHQPIVVNGNCEFTGVVRSTRELYKGQARCALMRAASMLDRLKQVGAYDNTFVVISSDHGIGFVSPNFANGRGTPAGQLAVLAGKAMALLVVKPFNSNGPVRTSMAPTTITDIPSPKTHRVRVPGRCTTGNTRIGDRRSSRRWTSSTSTAVSSTGTTGPLPVLCTDRLRTMPRGHAGCTRRIAADRVSNTAGACLTCSFTCRGGRAGWK
jgi:hypothetical protein